MKVVEVAPPRTRARRRVNGRDVRVKNAASARNARPKKVFIKHGGASTALRLGELDGRTRQARAERKLYNALVHDLGCEPTTMQAAVYRTIARLESASAIASAEVGRAGVFSPGAADNVVKVSRELLAWVESEQFAAMKPDYSLIKRAQAEALREMSTEALEAMRAYAFLKRGEAPPPPLTSEVPPPPLLLPAPAKRVRTRVRVNRTVPAPVLDPQTDSAPVVSPPDPMSRAEKNKRAREAAAEAPAGILGRADAPWNL